MSTNRHDWLADLAALSSRIASLNLTSKLPQKNFGTTGALRNQAAYNLSASANHNAAIARWIDDLPATTATSQIEKLLGDLTTDRSRTTYGAFSELAAYGAFARAGLPIRIQVPMSGHQILNPNGSDLDGEVELNNCILFDVKGFGLQDYLIEELLQRLSGDFSPDCIVAEGTWDVPITLLEDLLGAPGYEGLKTELKKGLHTRARRCGLELVRRPPQKVQISVSSHNPYAAAEQHADYAFRFAKQFPRRRRFLLVFVYHTWLGGFGRHVNFAGGTDTFLRAFARRTFLQFREDRKNRSFGVTRVAASRLLSGLLFIDAWQDKKGPRNANLFLNPNAKHPLSKLDRDALQFNSKWLIIDDFKHDFY